MENNLLIEAIDIKKHFTIKKNVTLKAIDGVNVKIYEGQKFGVVGESGCGKSTLGRVILQLYPQSSGKVLYYGQTLASIYPKYVEKDLYDCKKLQQKALNAYNSGDFEKAMALLKRGGECIGSLILNKDMDSVIKSSNEVLKLMKRAHEDIKQCLFYEDKIRIEGEKAEYLDKLKTYQDSQKDFKDKANEEKKKSTEIGKGEKYDFSKLNENMTEYLDSIRETGIDLAKLTNEEMRLIRADMQMIFQDPAASLDPRQTVGDAIAEVFIIHKDYPKDRRTELAMELLEKVGLKREHYYSYPNQLSGGQKQRVGIARAIAMNTKFIVLDEAVSALDVSVQAQILQLLNELSEEKGLTYFFITHNLGVAKHFCDNIMVMYLGNVCELAPSKTLFNHTLHPYTKSLLASVPRARLQKDDENEFILEGEVPSAVNPPNGCAFHTRCPQCMDLCKKEKPKYKEVEPKHFVACHLFR